MTLKYLGTEAEVGFSFRLKYIRCVTEKSAIFSCTKMLVKDLSLKKSCDFLFSSVVYKILILFSQGWSGDISLLTKILSEYMVCHYILVNYRKALDEKS